MSAPTTNVTVAASPTAASTPVAGPAYTAITVPPGRARLFAPADGACPFLLDHESDLTAQCNAAGYEITLTHGSESWFSAPGQTHTSGDVEVDALFTSFTGDKSQAAFGVTCESTIGLQAYFLAVKAAGGWAIVRYESSGAAMVLSQSGVAKDPDVAAASQWKVAGECSPEPDGSVDLVLKVNDKLLGQVRDSAPAYTTGGNSGVGIATERGSTAGAGVEVAGLLVTKPAPVSGCVAGQGEPAPHRRLMVVASRALHVPCALSPASVPPNSSRIVMAMLRRPRDEPLVPRP